ncbi:MAG TPA: glycosyltransferase family 87 protein [Phycisphaerae bacterium]|nr:glycosyltransferase family 87 protein [Phycisphaerae bacterium]
MRLAQLIHDRRWWVLFCVILAALSATYIVRGFGIYYGHLIADKKVGFADAQMRWSEVRYVLRRKNPFDVAFANDPAMKACAPLSQWSSGRDSSVDPDLGVPGGTVYPGWAYISALLFVGVPRAVLQNYYAAWMILSLAAMFAWGWTTGRMWGLRASLLFALSLTAIAGWTRAIYLGNYPLLLVLLLIVTLLLAERGHPLWAGLVLGIVLLKPTLTGPFVLVFLVRRDFKTVAVAGIYLAACSLVCWWLTRTDPLEMTRQMFAAGRVWVSGGYGPVQYLIRLGAAPQNATLIIGLLGFVLGVAAMVLARTKDLLVLFGIASIIARLWSYHYYYDDGVMLFALIALAVMAMRTNDSLLTLAFLAMGASLWAPAKLTETHLIVQLLQIVIWIAVVVVLVQHERARRNEGAQLMKPGNSVSDMIGEPLESTDG